MFFKQLVRCPYLLNSEELHLFVRPSFGDVTRSLTLLPKLNNQKFLERTIQFYSVMGSDSLDSEKMIQAVNQNVNTFSMTCKKNYAFLDKFKK